MQRWGRTEVWQVLKTIFPVYIAGVDIDSGDSGTDVSSFAEAGCMKNR